MEMGLTNGFLNLFCDGSNQGIDFAHECLRQEKLVLCPPELFPQ